MKRRLVIVEWIDSTRNIGWHAHEHARENRDMRCSSVGFLVDDDRDHVTVASHIAWPRGEVCDTMTIPRCSIRRIRRLGVALEPGRK